VIGANRCRDMRFLVLAFVSVTILATAACERPTGPELVARIDQVDRDLLSDTTAEHVLGRRFAGSWDLIRLLPNGRLERNLLANIDGKEHWLKAFVFERVVIRIDSNDGYSCPLVHRELLAIEGGRLGFLLKGSDFSQSVRESSYCESSPANFRPGAAPVFWAVRLGNGPSIVGVSGNARIDDAARTGGCDFLKVDRGFPLKVDCELRDYEVQLAVGLGIGKDDPSRAGGSEQRMLRVSHQRVPGLRLVIHCSERQDVVGGCEAAPTRPQD
jgi:hypothetical protein